MCGISGYVVLNGGATPDEIALHRMNEMLVHRGPDEAGHHACAQVGFAMRRLSIIDVEDGHQPVFSPGGEVMVVFNGEIYNHCELRRGLEMKGHSFKSHSDSEILPAMYIEYGVDMVEHLNGMFAIALWDFRRHRCFLWRDRFGQKPLYTMVWRGVFYFASEIKSLLALPRFPRKFDAEAMRQYLFLGQILCPRTPFQGIRSLPPANCQRITPEGVCSPSPYWDISLPEEGERESKKLSFGEYKEEFDNRIQKSVRRRLQSDVPLAATLSGGLDSSSVLYYASVLSSEGTEAFCITFESDEWQTDELNEAGYQEDVIRKLRVPIHRLNFFEKEEEIANEIDNAYWTYEFPDSVVQQEIVFTLLAREMYRNGFKVGLGGEGADEMMRGYEWYDPQYSYLQLLGKNGHGRQNRLAPKAAHMLQEEEWFTDRFGFPSILFQEQLEWRRISRLLQSDKIPTPFADGSQGLEHSDLSSHIPFDRFSELSGNALLQYADIKLRLPNFILNVQDKFTMSASVEMRSPFLDHSFAEWLVSLPSGVHRSRGREKYLFKQVMKDRLPKSVTQRKKQGYCAPYLQTEHDHNASYLRGRMQKSAIESAGIFNVDFVRKLNAIKKEMNGGPVPTRWLASRETEVSIPDLYLSRIADVQNFVDVFGVRFQEFRKQHLSDTALRAASHASVA